VRSFARACGSWVTRHHFTLVVRANHRLVTSYKSKSIFYIGASFELELGLSRDSTRVEFSRRSRSDNIGFIG
jgi:hypothetical protein